MLKGGLNMYPNYGYPNGGYSYPSNNNSSWGGIFAFILVIFILLVIIGCNCRGGHTNNCCSGCNNIF